MQVIAWPPRSRHENQPLYCSEPSATESSEVGWFTNLRCDRVLHVLTSRRGLAGFVFDNPFVDSTSTPTPQPILMADGAFLSSQLLDWIPRSCIQRTSPCFHRQTQGQAKSGPQIPGRSDVAALRLFALLLAENNYGKQSRVEVQPCHHISRRASASCGIVCPQTPPDA